MKPADLPPEWREWFEERAAIREYDGRQLRNIAEFFAMREVLAEMKKEEQDDAKPRATPAD